MTEEYDVQLPVGCRKEKLAFEKWYSKNVPVWTTVIERIARQAWFAGVEWGDEQERI